MVDNKTFSSGGESVYLTTSVVQRLANLVFSICFSYPLLFPACLYYSLYPSYVSSSLISSPLSMLPHLYSLSCLPPSLSFHFTLSITFFSLSLLLLHSIIGRKMYCTVCTSPSISFIVWVMVLSFILRVAI